MKQWMSWLFAGLAMAAGCASSPRTAELQTVRLRVLSYNIHHAEGEDGHISVQRIADVINDAEPDLVALQEVDVGTARVKGADLAAQIGAATRLNFRFGKAIDFQGGAYGQAILSRYPMSEATVFLLPGRADAERRIAVSVMVTLLDGRAVRFVSTHLDHLHDETDRVAQATELNRQLAADKVPTILAGDFNAKPDSKTIGIVQGEFSDSATKSQPTYPSTQPTRKIDWIFFRPPVAFCATDSEVLPVTEASDHRPILAVLEFRGVSTKSALHQPGE